MVKQSIRIWEYYIFPCGHYGACKHEQARLNSEIRTHRAIQPFDNLTNFYNGVDK